MVRDLHFQLIAAWWEFLDINITAYHGMGNAGRFDLSHFEWIELCDY